MADRFEPHGTIQLAALPGVADDDAVAAGEVYPGWVGTGVGREGTTRVPVRTVPGLVIYSIIDSGPYLRPNEG